MAIVNVRVRPGAAAERIGPWIDGVLSLAVSRPPAEGQATEASRRLLARVLEVPASSVRLVAGARSRSKRFEAPGLTDDAVARRLSRYRPPAD